LLGAAAVAGGSRCQVGKPAFGVAELCVQRVQLLPQALVVVAQQLELELGRLLLAADVAQRRVLALERLGSPQGFLQT